MVEQSFGLTFTNIFGALEALVSYLKWVGGQPAGKEDSSVVVEFRNPFQREPLKEGLSLSTSYLLH